MCFALSKDFEQKAGQIAHLDQDATNDSPANLAWLCLPHHDEYDSRTSQSKGYTEAEVKQYREHLSSEVDRWRQAHAQEDDSHVADFKQDLLRSNTGLFFFAAFGANEPLLRRELLKEVHDPDFRTQLIEAWAYLDGQDQEEAGPATREESMARYIGSTESGRRDLTVLLGLAGQAISWMNEKDRNHALFALHSDTIRAGLMLLHKIRKDRMDNSGSGA